MTSAERREQLINIARGLFAQRGYEATSVEEIAARAEVSKPVVYEHFGGKEGLYAVVVDRDGVERVSLREVTTGRREGNSVEVVHGLAGTERIVGNGAGLLNEGDLVTLASAPALLAKKEKSGMRQ